MAHGNLAAFKESQAKNALTAQAWLNRLVELSMCAFEWTGLPDSVDVRYLEKTLCEKGCVVFFRDDVTGDLLALRGISQGQFDVYGNPMIRQAIGFNGYTAELRYDNSVIVWNNYQRIPSFPALLNYARQLADIERTIEVNLNGQKSPKIIQCTKDQYLTFKQIELKTDGNQRYIFIDSELNPDTLKVHDMTVPYIADKLMQIKEQLWAEALGFIGIPANKIEKAERINLLELELSNASTNAQRYTKLLARHDAVKQINKLFGTDISVKFRFDEEVYSNGGVHDRAAADISILPRTAQR